MFEKTKRVIASIVLACGMFSLTALPSSAIIIPGNPNWVRRDWPPVGEFWPNYYYPGAPVFR